MGVNIATEKAAVEYDNQVISIEQIYKIIESLGYGVVRNPQQDNKSAIPVTGMSCTACASGIEKALSKTDGVKSANVNFTTEKAVIEYDPDKIDLQDIYEKIESLGYGVEKEKQSTHSKAIINIDGMSCAACSAGIEKMLRAQDGIDSAFVNLTTAKATVEYDSTTIRLSEIIDKINAMGYKAAQPKSETVDDDKDRKQKELRHLRTELIASIILSSPLLLGMILMLFKVDFPLLHNAIFQFIIATPVQFVIGFKFYRNAFFALKAKSANMDVLIAMGTSAAYFYSVYNTFFVPEGMRQLYFESAVVIITLILLGKYFEAVAKGRTSDAIKKLVGLQAKTARVIIDGTEKDIPIEEVKAGDIIVVRPGEKIPVERRDHRREFFCGRIDANGREHTGREAYRRFGSGCIHQQTRNV